MSKDNAEYRKLLASLQDPTVVKELAKKHGLLKDEGTPKKKTLEMGEFDLGIDKLDGEVLEQLPALLNKAFNNFGKHIAATIQSHFDSIEQETAAKTAEQSRVEAAKKVRAFMESKPDFLKHQAKIGEFYAKGHSIEESYRLAKLEAGEKVEETSTTSAKEGSGDTTPPVTPRHSSDMDEGAIDKSVRKPTTDIKQAISRNLDAVLKDVPDLLDT